MMPATGMAMTAQTFPDGPGKAPPACISQEELQALATRTLAEDAAERDATTQALVPESLRATAHIITRQPVVVSGMDIATAVFAAAVPGLRLAASAGEGDSACAGTTVMIVHGQAAGILSAERTVLNFLQRLFGIATLAAAAVRLTQGTAAQLLATRKTTPGLRRLERRAAESGGFSPHRMDLSDAILIKENHLACCASPAAAVRQARLQNSGRLPLEVEIESLEPLEDVIEAGADIVLLDNFTAAQVRSAVNRAGGRVLLEASGGITMDNLRSYAETGVHRISLGFITHSVPSADLSLSLHIDEAPHAS